MNLLKIKHSAGKLLAVAGLLWGSNSFAAGLMSPSNSNLPPLEIKEHHVKVVIEDGYAITNVEQVFHNPNSTDLEAKYSFPIPEKAAVGEFTYWIDGKAVTGEVLEKKQAKQIYEEEKQAGRETAITEQDSFKSFDISVYPVRAQQDVRTRLTYIQPAHVDTSIGRYVYPLEEGGVDEEKLSFWTYNEAVKEKFSFDLLFRSSYPIDQLRLPKHPGAMITQISEKEWSVLITNDAQATHNSLEEEAENTSVTVQPTVVRELNQDIVVYWRHAQGLPGSVDLITHKPADSSMGTFMMTVTPGDDLAKITEGRDWIFVLDYSGSMKGKYQSLIEGVQRGLKQLNVNDRFRIILFNNNARELTQGYLHATPENVTQAIYDMEQSHPTGGTNLYDGLALGMRTLDADRSSAIILITDGVANVGYTEKKSFLKLLEKKDVRLFSFVMGNSANRPLLEGMAKVSNGYSMNVSNSDDIVGRLMEATSKLTHEAFHDVEIEFSGVKVRNLTPERIGSLYRGQQLTVLGHYWGDGEAEVSIKGKISGESKTYSTTFDFPEQSELYPEIERLWAYAKIEDMQNQMDYFGKDADIQQAITDLAIEKSLVTDYTSMVVLREEEYAKRGIEQRNKKRVETEHKAREQRKQQPVRNHRVDEHKPMYSSPAPSHSSGGGALGPWVLLMLLPLLMQHLRTTNRKQ